MYIFAGCAKENPSQLVLIITPPVAGKTYSAIEVNGFKQLTVNGQFNNGTIKKLPPVSGIYLADTLYPFMTRQLDSIISDVNAQTDTDLVLKRTYDSSSAVIIVHLTDRATYIKAEPAAQQAFNTESYELDGLCFPVWSYSTNVLYHESVFIDMQMTKDSALQFYLLHHEIMHSLGFLGHVNLSDYMYTMMYYYLITPYITGYSLFDKRMMKLLYNPFIKPGMTEAELNEVIVNL